MYQWEVAPSEWWGRDVGREVPLEPVIASSSIDCFHAVMPLTCKVDNNCSESVDELG